MLPSTKPHSSGKFQHLIGRLSEILGSSGIDAEHVSAKQLCDIMTEYDSDAEDWMPLISKWPDADQPYVRNLVDGGNGKYNLVSSCSNQDIPCNPIADRLPAYISMEGRFWQ
jgi:hypothetical protein